ncbi:hypothetical protein Aperf_G00000026693 [Anoplocephala perfoliata]
MSSRKPKKIFQDSVQGIIEVGPIMLRFIDTPEFQRLHRLHQLGLSDLVYPNCTHTRFEHCLGTYHLAKRLVDTMQSDVKHQEARLSEGEGLSIMIAALCHDLGHGPLSHTWERFLRRGGPRYKVFRHEEMSCLILRRIVAKDEILRNMLEENGVDVDLVCALIRGHPTPELATRIGNRKFIFEIVSNAQNGNDIDKWDYIMRDSLHAGLGQGAAIIEVERMLRFYRPSFVSADGAWHMAFRSSERENVLQIFSQRLCLHRKVYLHKTSRILESMYQDIFSALDRILNLRELSLRAFNGDEEALAEFLRLDEHSLWATSLLQFRGLSRYFSPDISESLRQLNQFRQRIQFRQFYSVVGKFKMSKKESLSEWKSRIELYNRDLPKTEQLVLDATYAGAQSRFLSAFDAEVGFISLIKSGLRR